MCMTNWKDLLEREMANFDDCLDNIVQSTLSDSEMLIMFDDCFGCVEGQPFTVWTADRVYFPVCYDGSEWVGSVSRNPDGYATTHQGGG